MLPKWFTPLTVAAVAGLSIWLLTSESPKQPQLISTDQSVPDTFMEQFTVHNFDKNGKPRHELNAHYMAHYPADDVSEFTLPEILLYQSGSKRWRLSAQKGTATKDVKEIHLHGEVNIFRLSGTTGETELSIKTSEILIRPEDSYVETEEKIAIKTGKHNLHSVGIRANLNEGIVHLLSRVRGVYAL